MAEAKQEFKDWLVMRLWGRASEGAEICVLTTRGFILARHYRLYLRCGVQHSKGLCKKVPGLRRYKTKRMAKAKADKLNKRFETSGYSAIREDSI